jgi:small subunit ribosomal protein S20
MANIKSQIKRNRQNRVRATRNKAVRSELKTRIKKATAASGTAEAGELFRDAQRRVDIAAAKGIIGKRTAARRKSRLAKRLAAS